MGYQQKMPEDYSSGIFVLNETVPAGPMDPNANSRFDTSPRSEYRSNLTTADVDREVYKAPQRYTHTNIDVKKHQSTGTVRTFYTSPIPVSKIQVPYPLHDRGDEHRDDHCVERKCDDGIDNYESASRLGHQLNICC